MYFPNWIHFYLEFFVLYSVCINWINFFFVFFCFPCVCAIRLIMLLHRHYAVLIFRFFACLYFFNLICNINPPRLKQLPFFFCSIAFSRQPINNNFKLLFISSVRELAILRRKDLCLIISPPGLCLFKPKAKRTL